MKTTAGLKAGNTEMFLSMAPLASWPEDSPGNNTLRKRCYPTFLRLCYGPLKAGAVNKTGCGSRDNVKQRILLIPLRFPSEYVAVKNIAKNTRDRKVNSVLLWKIHRFPGCWIETSYLNSGSRRWLNLWTKPKPNLTKTNLLDKWYNDTHFSSSDPLLAWYG